MALIRLRTDEFCQDGETCAALYVRPGSRTAILRGYVITDPAVLAEVAELNAPAHEGFLEVPIDMLCNLRPEDITEVIS